MLRDNGIAMIGTTIALAVTLTGVGVGNDGIALPCESPLDLLARDLDRRPNYKLPVPGTPLQFSHKKASWVTVSLMPDLVGYETESPRSQTWSFSTTTDTRSLKAQLLKRVGLVEVRSRGFGATFRFASAPNWAFQFKGMRRLTVAYITRF